MRVSAVIASLLILAACPGEPVAPEPKQAAAIVVTPDVLTLAAGAREQLVAQVNDARGQPVGGAEIDYESLDPPLLAVSEHGLMHSLGPVGSGRIRVRSASVEAEVRVTIVPGAPFQLEKIAGDGQHGSVAAALPAALGVRVTDANGNPVPAAPLIFRPSDGSVEPVEIDSRSDGSVETRWTLGSRAGEQLLEASVRDAPRVVPTSFLAFAEAGPAAALEKPFSDPVNVVAGAAAESVRAVVTDAHGNPKPDVDVIWRVLAGGGSVTPAISTTDASGVAQTIWHTGPTVGVNRLEARAERLRRRKQVFEVETLPGPPARLVALSSEAQTGRPGEPVGEMPALRVVDANGNAVPAVVTRFRIVEGDGSIGSDVGMSDDEGVVRAEGWKLGSEPLCSLEAVAEGVAEPLRFSAQVEAP